MSALDQVDKVPELLEQMRTGLTKLSPQERVVLGHLAYGLSSKEIARLLGKGEGTVKNQLESIYAKLGVRNRAGAMIVALLWGDYKLDMEKLFRCITPN